MRLPLVVALMLASTGAAEAQNWNNGKIAEMLVSELSPTGAMESGQWFTSAPELTNGVHGLGIIYAHIPGSAGSVSIHAGLFYWTGVGWNRAAKVDGLFGMSPTDAAFLTDRVELSTTTLGPDDPRCCPSLQKRWAIDLKTGAAREIN